MPDLTLEDIKDLRKADIWTTEEADALLDLAEEALRTRAKLLTPITDEEARHSPLVTQKEIEEALRNVPMPCQHPRAYRTGGVGIDAPPRVRTVCPDCGFES